MHRKICLLITAQSDLVFSASSATVGEHKTLDYIPGSVLLGVAAKYLYEQDVNLADNIIYGGLLTFCNGLPLSEQGYIAYPMPFSWHVPKEPERYGLEQAIPETQGHLQIVSDVTANKYNLLNFQHKQYEGDLQPRQLRTGYVNSALDYVEPVKDYRLKTSIDETTGRSRENHLYAYESIRSGQQFVATIQVDDQLDSTIVESIIGYLLGRQLIGRSRLAEYGVVDCRLMDNEQYKHCLGSTLNICKKNKDFTIWCLSDLALQDEFGQASLIPTGEHFGIKRAKWIAEKSFLRNRNYSNFNRYYYCYEQERYVISQGSVLHFQLDSPLSEAESLDLLSCLEKGIGHYNQFGLGRVALNPELLVDSQPIVRMGRNYKHNLFPKITDIPNKNFQAINAESKLIACLKQRQRSNKNMRMDRLHGNELAGKVFPELYKRAKKINGVIDRACPGPGVSQWLQVLSVAEGAEDIPSLRQALFDPENGICQSSDKSWCIKTVYDEVNSSFGPEQRFSTYYEVMEYIISDTYKTEKNISNMQFLIRQLARMMCTYVKKKEYLL